MYTASSHASPATTLPREYVHKAAHSEVLLTGWHRDSVDAYTVTAQWPRTHGFYRPARQLHDPMLFVETVRQTIPLLSHVAYDVPLGHHLIWEHFSFSLAPESMRSSTAPAEPVLHVSCTEIERRRGNLAAMTLQVRAERDGQHLGTAVARFTSHSPAIYRRLRGAYGDLQQALDSARPPAPGVMAHQVGRRLHEDVVLAPTRENGRWQLRVDTQHPSLFDHPVDHAPGMLLLEAARQAAHATRSPRPVTAIAMRTRFHRYVELDAPSWIQTSPGSTPDSLSFAVEQDDAVCFSGEVTVSACAVTPQLGLIPTQRVSSPGLTRRDLVSGL
ncbi:ScbA/BarX family gamma-butyrolactone biosynthesis protein [Streptomyces sp. QL37]|uniref:ScbA/BarX family gamma-butyrolactone biosynthesis protein n=1 Tax=Streptomyces sp. QL37 TaxID=2093747 RepID=UPI0021CB1101|nr:ScbA/BarX family gamma-butyrolactone biosynthesis protein [Streptomyces sp. QL37]